MEERLRVRLEYLSLGASIALLIILTIAVPLFVLDYNTCTAPAEEKQLKTLLFYITVGVAVIAALVLAVAWSTSGGRKMKISCCIVLAGLAALLLWYVFYFLGTVCLTSP